MSRGEGDRSPQLLARRKTLKKYQPQTPNAFLPAAGEPQVPWLEWRDYWDNFMSLISDADTPAEEKRGVLLHAIGQEAHRIYRGLAELDPGEVELGDDAYTVALKKLDKYFNPRVNLAINRHSFFTRQQKEGESIDQYVAALKRLAVNCCFRGMVDLEEMIRDQIVVHARDKRIQERLWMHGNPTLQETLAIARKVELTALCSKTMAKEVAEPPVQKVKEKPKNKEDWDGGRIKSEVRLCFRCGGPGHFARDKVCPGWKNVCSKCKVRGHMPKMCRTKDTVAKVEVESDSDQEGVRELGLSKKVVSMVMNRDGVAEKCPTTVVKLDGCEVVMGVDSGSPYTIVPESWWRNVCGGPKLSRRDINPDGYGGGEIVILGYWWAEVEFRGRVTVGKTYVARKGEPIIGWTEIKRLGIKLDPAQEDPVLCIKPGKEGESIVQSFPGVFKRVLGRTRYFTHHIKEVQGAIPVVQAVRDVPVKWDVQVRENIRDMLEKGVIEEIDAARWVSPLVVAMKANGKLRLCIDLTEVNKNIWVERHPLPKIAKMLTKVKDAVCFSTLDLSSAYHQVPLTKRSRHLTAFITPYGLYQYRRMPFGLASAAGVFQRVMENVLEGAEGVLVFQDDILVYGSTVEEHNRRLEGVLKRLEVHGLTVEWEKCQIGKEKVDYLGHSVSGKGVGPRKKLVDSILAAPTPQDKDTLRSFLGMAEYYSRFVRNYSSVTVPLRKLMKKYARFRWSEECQSTFESIKEQIAAIECLGHFDVDDATCLTSDASLKGLGAVLSQVHEGQERVVAFASRALTDVEGRYSVVERELLAASWAMRHFRNYLIGCNFVLRTDHRPLVDVLTPSGLKRATPRILRLMTNMQGFRYEVEYIAGRENAVADCLSRLPVQQEQVVDKGWLGEQDVVAQVSWVENSSKLQDDWLAEALVDTEYQELMDRIVKGWIHKKGLSVALRAFYEVRNDLSIEKGIVVKGGRIVPPGKFRKYLMEEAHVGHLGMSMTKRKLRQYYWWPAMDGEVNALVEGCQACAMSDKTVITKTQPLHPLQVPKGPWEMLGVDILGPYNFGEDGPVYFMVLVDHFSKWPEVVEVRTTTAGEMIARLSDIFAREGYPVVMLSDNGPQFVAKEMQEYAKRVNVEWRFASAYHPETNGLVERMNRVITGTIQLASSAKLDWRGVLAQMLWSYKVTPHVTTGYTPFRLMRGREPKWSLLPGWASEIVCQKKGGVREAREELLKSKERMKEQEKGKQRCWVDVKCGMWVRTKRKDKVRKGESKYGPRLLVREVYRYALKLQDGSVRNKDDVVVCRHQPEEERSEEEELSGEGLEGQVVLEGGEPEVQVSREEDVCVGEQEEVLEGEGTGGGAGVEGPRRRGRLPARYKDYVLYS